MARHKPHLIYEDDRPFENIHQNIHFTPARYCDVWNFWDDNSYPETHRWQPGLAALKQLIQDAEQNDIRNARAFGAGWSLSHAIETKGFLANTKPLNIIEIGVHRTHCQRAFLAQAEPDGGRPEERLVFAQCGASISELNQALENAGFALPTSGASNGQTICGAMSTSTHGAAILLPNGGGVQDYVVGVHLLGAGGKGRWIQSQTHPVINRSFCNVIEPDLELVEDDHLFDAVRVAFGSFGIIHAVLLKVVPIYLLERHVRPVPFAKVAPVLSDLNRIPDLKLADNQGRIPDQLPYHFELLFNPYAFESAQNGLREIEGRTSTYVRYMFKRPADGEFSLRAKDQSNRVLSNDAFGVIASLSQLMSVPGIGVPGIANIGSDYPIYGLFKSLVEAQLQPDDAGHTGTMLTPGGTFAANGLAGHGLSMELGFALPDVPAALRIIVREMQGYPFATLPVFRFVRSSQALLAFTGFGEHSCAMEFPAALCDETRHGYERIWDALEKEKIRFAFHWGQHMKQPDNPAAGLAWLRQAYAEETRAGGLPPRQDRVLLWLDARRKALPNEAARRLFSNRMIESLGLSEASGPLAG